jgi:hypothetical protein
MRVRETVALVFAATWATGEVMSKRPETAP